MYALADYTMKNNLHCFLLVSSLKKKGKKALKASFDVYPVKEALNLPFLLFFKLRDSRGETTYLLRVSKVEGQNAISN